MTQTPYRDDVSAACDILRNLPDDELLDVLVDIAKTRAEAVPRQAVAVAFP